MTLDRTLDRISAWANRHPFWYWGIGLAIVVLIPNSFRFALRIVSSPTSPAPPQTDDEYLAILDSGAIMLDRAAFESMAMRLKRKPELAHPIAGALLMQVRLPGQNLRAFADDANLRKLVDAFLGSPNEDVCACGVGLAFKAGRDEADVAVAIDKHHRDRTLPFDALAMWYRGTPIPMEGK